MKDYRLICMSFDGEYVTDSHHNTIEDACETSADMGSKWFFYPFHFILSGNKVVETGQGLIRMKDNKPYLELMFKGRFFDTVKKAFTKTSSMIAEAKFDALEYEMFLIDTNKQLLR